MITVALAVLSAAAYGGSQFLTQLGLRGGRVSASQALFINLVAGTVFLAVVAVAGWLVDPIRLHPAGVLFFVAAGVAGPFAGRNLNFLAIQHVGATRTASLGMSEGLFAAVIGWVFLSQTLSPLTTVGLLTLVGGMALFVDESGRTFGHAQAAAGSAAPFPAGPAEAPVLVRGMAPAVRDLYARSADYALAGARRMASHVGGRSIAFGGLFALGSGLFFTLAWLLRVYGLETVPSPLIGSAIGTAVALVVVSLNLARSGRLAGVFRVPRADAVPLAASGITAALAMVSFLFALGLGGGLAVSTALKNLTPLFTFTLAGVFIARIERLSPRLGLLVALVVFGAVLTTLGRG